VSSRRFESLAHEWDANGRPASGLLEGYDLIALQCWTYSAGGKSDGASDTLRQFEKTSADAQPDGWIDAYLSERETCRACGESYRFENVRLCTHCSRTYCYRCASERPAAPNGNCACVCGGELVG
jgi:hypothetical protein